MSARAVRVSPLERVALSALARGGWMVMPNLRLSRAAKRLSERGFASRRQRPDGTWEYRIGGEESDAAETGLDAR